MKQRGRFGWLGLVASAFVTASAPVTISVDRGVQPQAAECQSGTCCPEDKSTCVIGGHQIGGYYHKAEGSCTNGN
jgi:hypothetical protein